MKVQPGDENAADDAVSGRYELHRELRSGDVVLDIGAHVGYFATRAAEQVGFNGEVYAFEPHPANFSRLLENCQGTKIQAINAAVSDADGVSEFYPMAGNSGGHSLYAFDGHLPPLRVKTVALGKWLMDRAILPNFIKIDAESSELAIINSLLETPMRPDLAIEVHTVDLFMRCRDALLSKGYAVLPETPCCTRSLMYAMVIDDIGRL